MYFRMDPHAKEERLDGQFVGFAAERYGLIEQQRELIILPPAVFRELKTAPSCFHKRDRSSREGGRFPVQP